MSSYSNNAREDNTTSRLKKYVNEWRYVFGLDAGTVSNMIREDQVDILVELTVCLPPFSFSLLLLPPPFLLPFLSPMFSSILSRAYHSAKIFV